MLSVFNRNCCFPRYHSEGKLDELPDNACGALQLKKALHISVVVVLVDLRCRRTSHVASVGAFAIGSRVEDFFL